MSKQYQGLAASPGIAIGKAWTFHSAEAKIDTAAIDNNEIDSELAAFRHAQEKVETHLKQLYQQVFDAQGEKEAEIFASHIEMLRDEEFEKDIRELIGEHAHTATRAVKKYLDQAAENMRALDDEYLKERAAEFKDLQHNLLLALNDLPFASLSEAPAGCIIFAEDLSPSETAQLDPKTVQGFVLSGGGLTSHVAILARNIGLPAVMGLDGIVSQVNDEQTVIVDGGSGKVIFDADAATIASYEAKKIEQKALEKEYAKLLDEPATSSDGFTLKLFSNIGSPQDLHLVEQNGSEGIGLFRSEFLFMESRTAPSEERQYRAYRQVVEHLGDRPVILRLTDIGGDKPLPYLNFAKEDNPFLGWRGVRIYREMRDIFTAQIRAALRASAHGNLWIMVPMVSNVEEITFVREEVRKQAASFQREGIACNAKIKIGIMIETPAAALIARQLANVSDFFSIGSNDLTQYTIAVDRGNTKISALYDSLHPAILRLMKEAADAAREAGIEIGVCGEMGGQLEAVPLLLGMGLSELSISGKMVSAVKYRIRQLSYNRCRKLLEQAILADDANAVRALLATL